MSRRNPYADISISYGLQAIFSSYDENRSGEIDPSEFTALISDLFEVRDGHVPSNSEDIAAKIASKFTFQEAVIKEGINLVDFVAAVKQSPSPFDHRATGKGLKETLLQKTDLILQLCRERARERNQHNAQSSGSPYLNSNRMDDKPPFRPSYEWQRIHPWQEPLQFSGLEIKMDSKEARIANPMQVQFYIPSLDRMIRFFADRNDSIKVLRAKASKAWPGLVSKTSPPSAQSIDLSLNGTIFPDHKTVEELGLFFRHKSVHVTFRLTSCDNNTNNSTSGDGKGNKIHDNRAAEPTDSSRRSTGNHREFTAPSSSATTENMFAGDEGGQKSDSSNQHSVSSSDVDDHQPVISAYDRLSQAFISISERLQGQLVPVLQETDDKILMLLDTLPEKGAIDDIDRTGLKDMAREIRSKIGETLNLWNSMN